MLLLHENLVIPFHKRIKYLTYKQQLNATQTMDFDCKGIVTDINFSKA